MDSSRKLRKPRRPSWQKHKNTSRTMRGGIRMSDLQKYKNKQLQDPEFKAEYERTRPEFEIMHALVDARISQNSIRNLTCSS